MQAASYVCFSGCVKFTTLTRNAHPSDFYTFHTRITFERSSNASREFQPRYFCENTHPYAGVKDSVCVLLLLPRIDRQRRKSTRDLIFEIAFLSVVTLRSGDRFWQERHPISVLHRAYRTYVSRGINLPTKISNSLRGFAVWASIGWEPFGRLGEFKYFVWRECFQIV